MKSLLDRLKKNPAEPDFQRELDWLFNAESSLVERDPHRCSQYADVTRSVLNYGLRGIFNGPGIDTSVIECKVKEALEVFEPRLRFDVVHVSIDETGRTFEIRGTFATQDSQGNLAVSTDLETRVSRVEVNL